MPFLAHEVADDRNDGIDQQADGNRLFIAPFFGQFAKQNRKRRGYKLHQQERAEDCDGAESQVCREHGCHGDDCANSVGVYQKGQQEPE